MDAIPSYSVCLLLGEKRLQRLVESCSNAEEALRIYAWELELGQALLKPIGIAEVFVRNALDTVLRDWWVTQGLPGEWTDRDAPSTILDPFAHRSQWVRRAASNRGIKADDLIHDDIIAHTSFGTWRNMIGNPTAISTTPPTDPEQRESWEALRARDAQCANLWKEVTHTAFERIPATKGARGKLSPRAYIGTRLSRIGGIRNRVCHWDNLMNIKVRERYDDMKAVVAAISSEAAAWMATQCDGEIDSIIEARSSVLVG